MSLTMKLPRVALGAVCLGLMLGPVAYAQSSVLQSGDAGRGLFVVRSTGGLEVRDGAASLPLQVAGGVRVTGVEGLESGWVLAGTHTSGARTELWLATGSASGTAPLPAPPGRRGPFVNRPVSLVEDGRLVGLAWLEGERHDAMAVLASAWSGSSWTEPVVVSAPDLGSQLALSGAVLADGSWQLVWSAVDGSDDEVFSARRRVDGRWRPRRQLNAANEVPDIHPRVVATYAGSLVAWNQLHDGHYRARLVHLDLAGRRSDGFLGPAGSIAQRLLAFEDGAVLLYKRVIPDRWAAIEIDPRGAPLRMALAEVPGYEAPVVVRGEEASSFGWPASPAAGPLAPAGAVAGTLELDWRSFDAESLAPPSEPDTGPDGAEPEGGGVTLSAFGDSITRATGWPFFASLVFDVADDGEGEPPGPACAQSGNTFNIRCGYNWRLEDELDGTFATDIANDGYGGEVTSGGLSRIDGVLAGGDDIILIMEGSNDLSDCLTSATTVRNNIGLMVDKATAAGLDSVIASVAKRRPMDENQVWIPDGCENAATTELKNKLLTLAGDKNRAYADVYNSVVPQASPIDYWNSFPGQVDPVGHPDASGFAKIWPKFSAPILADSPLGAPNPIGPSGGVGATPTFSWNTVGNARLYSLSVTGAGNTWLDAEAVCTGSVCSASVGALSEGSHTWQVAGKNLRGLGTFSAAMAFEVFTQPPASAPATGEPIGDCQPDCYGSSPFNLSFEFDDVADATEYDLELSDGVGVISSETFQQDAICSMGNCAAPSTTDLPAGDFKWRVQAANPAGNGPWAVSTSFSLYDSVPSTPIPYSPLIETFETTPVYRWSAVAGATEYRLVVPGTAIDTDYMASSICAGLVCEIEPAEVLAFGAHDWRVRPSNPVGNGVFTADQSFEVLDCAAYPTDLSLDATDTGSATYRACPGSITSTAGFEVANGETVTLHADTSVLLEGIVVESGGELVILQD